MLTFAGWGIRIYRALHPANVPIREHLARLILIVGILSLLGAVILVFTRDQVLGTGVNEIRLAPAMSRPLVKGNAMGDPNAPVKIIEFSDFQCAYCLQFFLATEQPLIEDYVATGKVFFVYRTLGDWLGPASQASAEAAYCAGDQAGSGSTTTCSPARAATLSPSRRALRDAGLDEKAFDACMNACKVPHQVLPDLADSSRLG
jgi:hypothetical protein